MWNGCRRDEVEPLQVHAHHAIPLGLAGVGTGAFGPQPRRVDDGIEPFAPRRGVLHGGAALSHVEQISGDHEHTGLAGHGLHVDGCHLPAAGEEALHDRAADATRRTGDEHGLAHGRQLRSSGSELPPSTTSSCPVT